MAKEKEESVFDVEKVRDLVKLMEEHDLSEVDLRNDAKRIKLRRGGDAPTYAYPPAATMPVAPTASASTASNAAAAPAEDEGNFEYITSPTVGTFYSKPKPDSDNFVKVGDMVEADTVVCLVEAMKMFNEIQAGMSGKIVSCLVKNEEPVDVNKPLFKIEPN